MKKYLFIVLLVGVGFGQDVYPYFSDMAKQPEFEKNKIVISEGESKQQIISGGGSQFNLLSIFNNKEPRYLNAPIKTKYRYISYFNINVDNKPINEITFNVKSIEEIDRISQLIRNEGSTEVRIHITDKNKDLSFKLKNKRLIDRKSINRLRNEDISAIIH